jgi:hypothetical protein
VTAGVPLWNWLTVSLSSVRQPSRPALSCPALIPVLSAVPVRQFLTSSVRHLTVPLAVCGSLCCSLCQLRRAPVPVPVETADCQTVLCRPADCLCAGSCRLSPHSTALTSSACNGAPDVPACPAQPCQTSLCRCAHSRHPLPTAQPPSPQPPLSAQPSSVRQLCRLHRQVCRFLRCAGAPQTGKPPVPLRHRGVECCNAAF